MLSVTRSYKSGNGSRSTRKGTSTRRSILLCILRAEARMWGGAVFMRATCLVSLVVPLLVVPGLAAAQSRYFSYERGIDRPGHAYRFLETQRGRL